MIGLKHKEPIYQRMVEASPNALLLVNQKGKISYLNNYVKKIFKYDSHELIGKKLSILIPNKINKNHPNLLQSYFKNITNSTKRIILELFALKKDEVKFPVQINLDPITTADGIIILATIIDFSERKKTEVLGKQYEYFFNATLDFSCIANVQGYFETVNPQFQKVLGYSKKELLENQFFDFIHPDDIPSTLKEVEKLKKGALTINFVNRYRKKNGEYLWFEWSTSPDPATGKLYAIARDITEKKKAENQFRVVVESSPNSIILVNENGEIKLINTKTEELFGYNRSELVGNKIESLTPDIYENNHALLWNQFLKSPQARSTGVGRELYVKRKDGAEILIEIAFNPISTTEGDLILITIIDITDRKKKEVELEHYRQKLEKTNKNLNHFASVAAHDMKSPLNSGIELVYLIEYVLNDKENKKIAKYIKLLKNINYEAKDLINGILEYSKDSFSTMELTRIDLGTLIAKIKNKHKSINKIVINIGKSMPVVNHYETALTQVINNLMDNAIKYNDKEICEIYWECVDKNDHYEVTISDNGPGIAKSDRERVFDLFENLKSKKKNSTGIGLATVKKIITETNGRIWVESSSNGGAKFIFTLDKLNPQLP